MSEIETQSKGTPGPCDCHMEPVNDNKEQCDLCSEATETNNGIGWKIVRCSIHATAPDGVELARAVVHLLSSSALDKSAKVGSRNHVAQILVGAAQAILSRVAGAA